MVMDDCQLGDVVVKDKDTLGCDFVIGDTRVCFVTLYGCDELMRWMAKKLGYVIVDPHEDD